MPKSNVSGGGVAAALPGAGVVGDAATSALTTTSDLVVGGRAAASTVLSFGAATVLAPRPRLRLSLRVGCRLQPPTWQANTMHICKNRCIFVANQ